MDVGSAATCLLLATSCGGLRGPLPPPPTVVQVVMLDYRLDYSGPIPRGRVVFEVRNDGRNLHRMTLAPMPPGSPSLAEVIAGTNPRAVTPVAGVPNLKTGQSDSFAVDLGPGRYLMVDLGIGPDHQSNARKGMASDFVVS